MNITTEQGKTLKDAQGDVFRGLGSYFFCPFVIGGDIWLWSRS